MLIDDKKAALSTLTGMTSSIPDMELKWLQTSTGSSEFSIPQLWYIYLTTLGYSGSIPDMKVKYFQSLGYSGALPEMEAAFWASGGAPSWGATMDRWWDFTRNIGGVPTTITDIHAQSHLADNVAGVYSSFAADVLVRTNKGIQTVPTRAQLLSAVTDLTNAAWTALNGTVASSAIPAFDATNTLQLVTATAGGNRVQQNSPALTNGATYTQVFEMRSGSSIYGGIVCFGVATRAGAIFNLSTGAVVSTTGANAVSAAITRSYDGNWLASLTFTAAAAEIVQPGVGVSNGSTYNTSVFPSATSGTIYAGIGNLYLGSFAVPPILSNTTVNGNQPRFDITGLAALGIRGIIRVDIRDVTTTYKSIFMLNPGSTATDYITLYANEGGSRCVLYSVAGGVVQAGIVLPTALTVGVNTFAFAASANYVMCRRVGDTAPSADTSGTLPSMSRFEIGGNGVDTWNNIYQITKQLALDFGPQDATTFADVYAKAQILDALP